jgi:preprotein translocase subunit SecY
VQEAKERIKSINERPPDGGALRRRARLVGKSDLGVNAARIQEYLGKIVTRITLLGSLFLGIVAVSPYALGALFGDLGGLGLSLGGTGLLIAVSVVVETMKQLEAQMLMRNYEGFIK